MLHCDLFVFFAFLPAHSTSVGSGQCDNNMMIECVDSTRPLLARHASRHRKPLAPAIIHEPVMSACSIHTLPGASSIALHCIVCEYIVYKTKKLQ
jgi:hypothetical protein